MLGEHYKGFVGCEGAWQSVAADHSARTCCAVLHVGPYVVKLSFIVKKQPFEELKVRRWVIKTQAKY
jgi:hypothetical protein